MAEEIAVSDDCQVIKVQLTSFDIFVVYRSPNQSEENFEHFIDFIESIDSPNFLLTGDLNLPDVPWSAYQTNCDQITRILNHLSIRNATQFVNVPTHEDGNTLDLLIATPNIVMNHKVTMDPLISDHFNLMYTIKTDHFEQNLPIIPFPKEVDSVLFASRIASELNWCELDYKNINSCAEFITDKIVTIFEELTPLRKLIPEEKNGFLATTNQQIKHVKHLRKLNSIHLPQAIEKRDRLLKMEDERRINNYIKRLEKDKQNIYKTFSKRQFEQRISYLKDDTGQIVTDPSEISERLNLYYGSVLKKSEKCDVDWDSSIGIISDLEITEQLVYEAIMNAKMSNSRGPDNISNRMLKCSPQSIVLPLTLLFRQVLEQSELPNAWTVSVIRPIAKAGADCSLPQNTRPISCESNLSKILEKIICDHIYKKLEDCNFFGVNQYGFRKSRSTDQCISAMFNQMFKDLQSGWSVIVITIDYKKCFDLIRHHIMLRECFKAGISGKIGKYLQAWTENRTQYVEFEGRSSAHVQVTSSTVQGSHLGPILFLILNNSVGSIFEDCLVFCYADDQNIYFRFRNVEDLAKLQADLDRFTRWLEEIMHEVNLSKCYIMTFGPLRPDLSNIKINDTPLQPAEEIKFLGILINPITGFENQRIKTLNKVKRASAAARIMLKHAPFSIKAHTWTLYIKPLYCYAATTWFNWRIIDLLDDEFSNFFSGSKPTVHDRIPLSPSQEIILLCLKKIRDYYVVDNFASLAGARTSLADNTRLTNKSWLFLNKHVNYNFKEVCLAWAIQKTWNLACPVQIRSDAELFNFVTSATEQHGIRGAQLRIELSNGELLSKTAKRFKFLQELAQSRHVWHQND